MLGRAIYFPGRSFPQLPEISSHNLSLFFMFFKKHRNSTTSSRSSNVFSRKVPATNCCNNANYKPIKEIAICKSSYQAKRIFVCICLIVKLLLISKVANLLSFFLKRRGTRSVLATVNKVFVYVLKNLWRMIARIPDHLFIWIFLNKIKSF